MAALPAAASSFDEPGRAEGRTALSPAEEAREMDKPPMSEDASSAASRLNKQTMGASEHANRSHEV